MMISFMNDSDMCVHKMLIASTGSKVYSTIVGVYVYKNYSIPMNMQYMSVHTYTYIHCSWKYNETKQPDAQVLANQAKGDGKVDDMGEEHYVKLSQKEKPSITIRKISENDWRF